MAAPRTKQQISDDKNSRRNFRRALAKMPKVKVVRGPLPGYKKAGSAGG